MLSRSSPPAERWPSDPPIRYLARHGADSAPSGRRFRALRPHASTSGLQVEGDGQRLDPPPAQVIGGTGLVLREQQRPGLFGLVGRLGEQTGMDRRRRALPFPPQLAGSGPGEVAHPVGSVASAGEQVDGVTLAGEPDLDLVGPAGESPAGADLAVAAPGGHAASLAEMGPARWVAEVGTARRRRPAGGFAPAGVQTSVMRPDAPGLSLDST